MKKITALILLLAIAFLFGPQAKLQYVATCCVCGKQVSIPFEPAADRPLYCADCMGED